VLFSVSSAAECRTQWPGR